MLISDIFFIKELLFSLSILSVSSPAKTLKENRLKNKKNAQYFFIFTFYLSQVRKLIFIYLFIRKAYVKRKTRK